MTGSHKDTIDIKSYRKIDRLSYSSLKLFIENRKKFYKQEILGETIEKDETESMLMGNLVDVLLTDDDNWDHYFHVSSVDRPTGQKLEFVEALFKLYKQSLNEEGEPTRGLVELAPEAYEIVRSNSKTGKLRDDLSKFITNFETLGGAEYYQELIAGIGKTTVTANDIDVANKIIESLSTHPNTSRIVNLKGDRVKEKFPILFNYRGRDLKCELDKLEFVEEQRLIQPYDYKNTAFLESFIWKYFENKYYLQGSLYRIALRQWADENGYKDWNIGYMRFIVSDSINYYSPLIYETDEDCYEAGVMGGFTDRGYPFKGINQILEEITIHEELEEWNMSTEAILAKGRIKIPTFSNRIIC